MSVDSRLQWRAWAATLAFLLSTSSTNVAMAVEDSPAPLSGDQGKVGGVGRKDAERADAGESRVNAFGAFTDVVPITVPSFRTIAPALSLAYTSAGGNGWVGVGWKLDGINEIERASPGKGAPRYDASDIFLLDGEELIPCVSGSVSPSCTTGGTHSTKTENYLKITQTGSGTSSTWTITEKDGTKSLYGAVFVTPGADGVSGNSDDQVFRWGVRQVIDTKSNVVTYNWGSNLFGGSWEYLDSITYGGTTIRFSYEARSDVESAAMGGGRLSSVSGRIKTIDISSNGGRLRAYKLSYVTSGATGRSLLSSVQEFGRNATLDASQTVTGGTSLPAINVGYPSVTSPSFVMGGAASGMGHPGGDDRFLQLDINGDGKTDLVELWACLAVCPYQLRAWLSTGNGFTQLPDQGGLPNYSSSAKFFAMDVNGDGMDDLVALTPSGSRWQRKIWLSNGSGFTAGATDTSMVFTANSHFLAMDIDGDGKSDLLEVYKKTTCTLGIFCTTTYPRVVWLSNGSSFTQASVTNVSYDSGSDIYAMDFNGDGKSDYLEIVDPDAGGGTGGTPSPTATVQRRVWLSNGTAFTAGAVETLSHTMPKQISEDGTITYRSYLTIDTNDPPKKYNSTALYYPIDVNGDGKTDLVEFLPAKIGTVGTSPFTYEVFGSRRNTWLSTGDKFVLASSVTSELIVDKDTRIFTGDFNGDGRSDYVAVGSPGDGLPPESSGGTTGGSPYQRRAIFLSTGSDFVMGTVDTLPNAMNHRYFAGNFSGDGRADMVDGATLWRVGDPFSDLVTSLGNGLGGTTTVSYTPSSAWTNVNGPPVVQTATAVTVSDGRGGSATTTFSYSGLRYDPVAERSLGFATQTARKPCITGETACPYDVTTFRQDDGAATLPSRIDQRDGSGQLLRSQIFDYTTNGATLPWTARATGRWEYAFSGSGTACPGADCKRKYTSVTYNAYGEVTQEVDYGDYDVSGDENTTTTLYVPNTSAYIVNLPADVKRFQGVGTAGTILNETLAYYDGATTWNQAPSAGFATKTAHWLSSPSSFVTTQKTYDSWGNVTSATNEIGASTTFVFDATYHLFPTSVTNALDQTTTTTWDTVCGQPTQTVNLNGQATTLTYDALCRLVTKTEPGGKFETHSWVSLGVAANQYEQVDEPAADGTANARWSRRYFDGQNRTYQTVGKGPDTATGNIYVDTTYNARGEKASSTAAYYYVSGTPTKYTTTFGYDAMDRPTRVTSPDGASTTTSYGLWSITNTDELGRSKTDRFNAHGKRVSHTETVGGSTKTTSFVYDARQNLQQTTDPAGNVTTTLTTDSLGRVTTEVDVDRGTTTFEYDGKGRLTATTDAKNQRTTFDYDALDRKISKTTNAGTAQASTVSWSYDESQAGYFNVGALTSMTDEAGAKTFDYDVLGRLVHSVRTIDGTNYTFAHGFDAGGRALWTTYPDGDTVGTPALPLLYDSAGRLKSIPGYVTSAKYDAKGDVTQINNANGTVTTRAYSAQRGWIDAIATMFGTTKIQDLVYTHNAKGMVSAVTSPFVNEAWSYAYDELDRLTTATNTLDGTQSQTFGYDVIGNITTNSRIGTYSYHATKKHAVTAAGGGTYAYDAAGLMISGPNRTLSWNGDNRLASVTAGGTTMTFRYDANGDRIVQLEGMTSHRYLGDDYEISGGSTKKYIALAGMPVARKDGTTKTWIHTDHLGTIQAETDASGTEIHRRKFRPFGEMITMGQPLDVEPRGYTGQRQDASGLVYLHARYYDPALGRFVSGDDVIDGPDTVGLNRYAYTGNDPVNRSDVSGQCITCIDYVNQQEANGNPLFANRYKGPADPTTVLDRAAILSLFIPIPGAALVKVGMLGRSLLPNLRVIASGGPAAGLAARATTTTELVVRAPLIGTAGVRGANPEVWAPPRTPTFIGWKEAQKTGVPDSIYERVGPKGELWGRTFYDSNGRGFARHDYNHSHGGQQPHEHWFEHHPDGLRNGNGVTRRFPDGYESYPTWQGPP